EIIVTCFWCNGSLQNWRPNNNPLIEHVHWFPYCAYAKQFCGEELYSKIQESKRIQQDDDFVSDCNLYVACLILQKQIEYFGDRRMDEQISILPNATQSIENRSDIEVITSY
ncbi:unnamed protein product, partial [Rotaria sp. Silwood1]